MKYTPSDLIRKIEKAAWIDMLETPPLRLKETLGIATLKTQDAGFLACQGLPSVPFNRMFALAPNWSLDVGEQARGIAWMDVHASKGWVSQIDDQDTPKALGAISQFGFAMTGAGWSKFLVKLPTIPSGDLPPAVRLVASEQEAEDFASVVSVGFGFPGAATEWFKALAQRAGWSCFVAYAASGPAAAAAMFSTSVGAWFGIDTTIQSARRLGLHQSLILARIVHASRNGLAWAMAETGSPASAGGLGDASYRNYQRAGFRVQHESVNFARTQYVVEGSGFPT